MEFLSYIASAIKNKSTINIQIQHEVDDQYVVRFTPELMPLEKDEPQDVVMFHHNLSRPFVVRGTPEEIDTEIKSFIGGYVETVEMGIDKLSEFRKMMDKPINVAVSKKANEKEKVQQSDDDETDLEVESGEDEFNL